MFLSEIQSSNYSVNYTLVSFEANDTVGATHLGLLLQLGSLKTCCLS